MLLFRAYYDAFVKLRVTQEEVALVQARALLSDHSDRNTIDKALSLLRAPYAESGMSPVAPLSVDLVGDGAGSVMAMYGRLHALAGILRVTVGIQLTLHYGGQHAQRGAFFCLAWMPVTDLPYVRRELEQLLVTCKDPGSLQTGVAGLLQQQRAQIEGKTSSCSHLTLTSLQLEFHT